MGFLSFWSYFWGTRHLSTVPESEDRQRIGTRICDLPDDLLLKILLSLPTKHAATTTILSKRWRHVWTMLPALYYKDEDRPGSKSVGYFIEESLQVHKAPKLQELTVELSPRSPFDVDVGKCVENAVNRGVKELKFKLCWNVYPTSLPTSLYTCDTLVDLTLSYEILVEVSSQARLPSLLYLTLNEVEYKDEDSLVKLLSSSPVLKRLSVCRRLGDNLRNFTVKVSSLQTLSYVTQRRKNEVEVDFNGSLVIDSPALTNLELWDVGKDHCLIENMPCLDMAQISVVDNPSDKFLRSLSSVIHLDLLLTKPVVTCCNAIEFPRLIELYFCPDKSVDWLDPLMFLLQNSPKLKSLTIHTNYWVTPPSWNQPSCIPGCLSSHLEIFGWRGYGGTEDEKQLMTYILANSKCLNTVKVSFKGAASNRQEKRQEIESMPSISTPSLLLFPTQRNWRFNGKTSSWYC